MIKVLFSVLMLVSFMSQSHGQIATPTAYSDLNGNNVNTKINSGGVLFNDQANSFPAYEFPAQSGNHLIYASSFWFAGKDVNGQVKVAAPIYNSGEDMWPGPLTTNGTAEIDPTQVALYDQVWKVSKAEIDNHIANFQMTGYVVPPNILEWPAHGDVSLFQDFYLAPFVDTDGNEIYEPENGDYPLIRGDEATYMILNDKADIHSGSGGDPIGIECHYMVYQYNSSDALNNTTFINLKLINRGTETLSDFTVGSFLDSDLGDPNDDLMGCDSTRNLMFSYNGSNTDAEYGENPPAVGFVSLNHDLGTVGVFSNFAGPASMPLNPAQYHLNMTGYFNDGSPRTLGGNGYNGSVPNKFQYHGNPNDLTEWSEYGETNLSSDRRMIAAVEPFVLVPDAEICFDFAMVVGEGQDFLGNVTELYNTTDFVQEFYDQQSYSCQNFEVLSNSIERKLDFIIYPQPALDGFRISIDEPFNYTIFSMDGKMIDTGKNTLSNQLLGEDLLPGSYLIKIHTNEMTLSRKIMIK